LPGCGAVDESFTFQAGRHIGSAWFGVGPRSGLRYVHDAS
jgi:hypothetical protein